VTVDGLERGGGGGGGGEDRVVVGTRDVVCAVRWCVVVGGLQQELCLAGPTPFYTPQYCTAALMWALHYCTFTVSISRVGGLLPLLRDHCNSDYVVKSAGTPAVYYTAGPAANPCSKPCSSV